MKKIMSNKRRVTEYEMVALTLECNFIIQNRLSKNLKDSDSFSVKITIGQSVLIGVMLFGGNP